jgi:hypothetical protein
LILTFKTGIRHGCKKGRFSDLKRSVNKPRYEESEDREPRKDTSQKKRYLMMIYRLIGN